MFQIKLVLEVFADAVAQFGKIVGSVSLGESVVGWRQNSLFDLDDFHLVDAFFTGDFAGHEIGGKIDCAGDERFGRDLNPEIFLFGEAASNGIPIGDRFAFAGAVVVEDDEIVFLYGAVDGLEFGVLSAQRVHGFVDVLLGNAGQFALGGQTAIVGHLEFRSRFDGGGKLERLAFGELDFFDVGVADHFELLVFDSFLVGLGDELALDLVGDVLLVTLDDHIAGGFAGTKSGEGGFALEVFGHGFESGVDGGGVHFEANQLFAGS